MTAHVLIRRIAPRDFFWVVKDFLDTTLDTGHARSSKAAKKDARACRNYWINRIKEETEARSKLPKLTDGGRCAVSANLKSARQIIPKQVARSL